VIRSDRRVQSRFAETRFAEKLTLTLALNPNFGESGFGETGRHRSEKVFVKNETNVACSAEFCILRSCSFESNEKVGPRRINTFKHRQNATVGSISSSN